MVPMALTFYHRDKLHDYCKGSVIFMTLKYNFRRLDMFIWISFSDIVLELIFTFTNLFSSSFANSAFVRIFTQCLLLVQLYVLSGLLNMKRY